MSYDSPLQTLAEWYSNIMLLVLFCNQKLLRDMHIFEFQVLDQLPIPKGYLPSTRRIICRVDIGNE